MIKLLLVDDDRNKRGKIFEIIVETLGARNVHVVEVASSIGAAKQLEADWFHLLVLDLNLPVREDKPPQRDGGFRLLRQISGGGPRFQRPAYILGVTGYHEVQAEFGSQFADEGWQVVRYEPDSEEWARSLRATLLHIASIESPLAGGASRYDLAIITALKAIELEAVLHVIPKWSEVRRAGDPTIYHAGEFERGGRKLKVVAAAANEMGMPAAACLSMKLIQHFRPRVLAMGGIAAGVGLNFGDIIIADSAWDYGSGKVQTVAGGSSAFAPAPNYVPMDADLKERVELFLSRRTDVLGRIQREWQGNAANTPLMARLGPVASGAAVIENEATIEAIKAHNRKVLGIEMESYAVYLAARVCAEPRPIAICVKSVCDFGKPPKTDEYQKYAAYTSAAFIHEFAIDQLI